MFKNCASVFAPSLFILKNSGTWGRYFLIEFFIFRVFETNFSSKYSFKLDFIRPLERFNCRLNGRGSR